MSPDAYPPARLDPATGALTGQGVTESTRTLAGLRGYFREEAVRASMPQEVVVYRVRAFEPIPEGRPGAICCATTSLEPGVVGDEYFLTRGHFHAAEDRPELEVAVRGRGVLVLMKPDGYTRVEWMGPGSLHHVPPSTAHLVVNVGVEPLVFESYWPSETGHDYEATAWRGFGLRVLRVDGRPRAVPAR
ncbi:MAG: glucose-6-phosphate isomerase [Chthonomonadales bacterium]|nr:glucose-6-phosphate isomerase [Chthonomonadales bacterium]